jgi:hypothetical protein
MPETTTGIELKLENGNIIKAENSDEALKIAAKMIEDNSKAYRETKSKLDDMATQMATLQQRVDTPPPAANTNGFSKDRYYQLLNEDPLNAQNYVDAYRFGINDPQQVPGFFTNMYQSVTNLEQQALASVFLMRHPEFPQDDEPSKQFTQRFSQLVNGGHPPTVDTMELTWKQLTESGAVKPLEIQEEEQEFLPPSMGGGGGAAISDSEAARADQMSDKDLEALLRSKGLLK